MEAEQELLKREVEELCQLIETSCANVQGAKEFLKTHSERVTPKIDRNREKEFAFFVVKIKNNDQTSKIKTIYYSKESFFYNAEVTIDTRKDKYSKNLSPLATTNLKEAIVDLYCKDKIIDMSKEKVREEVEKLAGEINTACTTDKGTKEFLETAVKGIWHDTDNEKGTEFVIVIKTKPDNNSLCITFKPDKSKLYSAKVIGNIYREDEQHVYLSKEATETIKEIVLSTLEEKSKQESGQGRNSARRK